MPTPRSGLGHRGEEIACQFLGEKGYEILATNYRCRWGEVDIVARDGEELVFVEVRTRHSVAYGIPEESLTPAKVRRLLTTSRHYLQQHADAETGWRVDLVCVRLTPDRRLERIDHFCHAIQL